MTKGSEPTTLIRINRYLSMCGVASRRKADQLILQGKVEVNGKVLRDLGAKIDPSRDKVFVDGKQVALVHDYVYLVMNKPKDTITTLSDEKGRTTVMSLVRTKQRVYPIGRLDRNTTGVLLLTNDGEFANRLMHPKFEIPKSYLVTLDEPVKPQDVEHLRRGVKLADGMTAPAEVFVVPGSKRKEVGITIHEGRNRQVHRMFEALGYRVKKLDRVAYGPVTTEGLARGKVRPLTPSELRKLREMAGLN
ncbi:MAG TPA: pseudouridine synthase [Bacteroidota bacterium]|nr:pseudouridine synthase [Bacteroidota bacterium]